MCDCGGATLPGHDCHLTWKRDLSHIRDRFPPISFQVVSLSPPLCPESCWFPQRATAPPWASVWCGVRSSAPPGRVRIQYPCASCPVLYDSSAPAERSRDVHVLLPLSGRASYKINVWRNAEMSAPPSVSRPQDILQTIRRSVGVQGNTLELLCKEKYELNYTDMPFS